MAIKPTAKAKKLVEVRQRQEDAAAMEMGAALSQRNKAKTDVDNAAIEVDVECDSIRQSVGKPVNALDLELASQCVISAKIELNKKEQELKRAEKNFEDKRELLLTAHKKVKQMETLFENLKTHNRRQLLLNEQNETDDLATSREFSE